MHELLEVERAFGIECAYTLASFKERDQFHRFSRYLLPPLPDDPWYRDKQVHMDMQGIPVYRKRRTLRVI
jgi:hypothetical protein